MLKIMASRKFICARVATEHFRPPDASRKHYILLLSFLTIRPSHRPRSRLVSFKSISEVTFLIHLTRKIHLNISPVFLLIIQRAKKLRNFASISDPHHIGVARGCSGCTCTPQGGEKNFSGVIYRENVCTP